MQTPPNAVATRAARVAVVGTGYVGSTTAYALLISGTAAEIVLIDRNSQRAKGEVQDLKDAELFSHTTRILAGDFADCGSADVIIVTAGVGHRPGAPRLEYLKENASIVKGIVEEISKHNPCGILLIASNPVDVLTYGAWKWSGLPVHRVLGSGTTLDTSRFRMILAEHCGMSPNNVHAYIVGEHGDSQVPVLSSARIAGVPLEDFYRELQLPFEEEVLRSLAARARTAAAEIIDSKGATYYGIAAALVRIVDAILRDEHAVLTVSSVVPNSMTLGDVALSLPTIVGRDGIKRVLPIALSHSEDQALRASAAVLHGYIATLEAGSAAAA
jgi:L-lactate dehydrogenase